MKGIGLVLAGGGGKGAYQIGVWKYLHEQGLDRYVQGVSGTSVGALNAALFATKDYESAERLWLNIEPGQILSPKKFSIQEIMGWIERAGVGAAFSTIVTGAVSSAATLFASSFSTMLGRTYAFSRDGLIELMQKNVDFWAIQQSELPCYATCLSVPWLETARFDLRDYSEHDTQTILLATSAIPLVFDLVEFQGTMYCDGGIPVVGDNVPITPIYELGVEYIVVVHLSQDTVIDRSLYPNSKIFEITPQTDLGGPVDGTLDFTSSGAKWRIEQGYRDVKRVFDPFVEQIVLQKASEQIFQQAIKKHEKFACEYQELKDQEAAIRRRMETDGFDELYKRIVKEDG